MRWSSKIHFIQMKMTYRNWPMSNSTKLKLPSSNPHPLKIQLNCLPNPQKKKHKISKSMKVVNKVNRIVNRGLSCQKKRRYIKDRFNWKSQWLQWLSVIVITSKRISVIKTNEILKTKPAINRVSRTKGTILSSCNNQFRVIIKRNHQFERNLKKI